MAYESLPNPIILHQPHKDTERSNRTKIKGDAKRILKNVNDVSDKPMSIS